MIFEENMPPVPPSFSNKPPLLGKRGLHKAFKVRTPVPLNNHPFIFMFLGQGYNELHGLNNTKLTHTGSSNRLSKSTQNIKNGVDYCQKGGTGDLEISTLETR